MTYKIRILENAQDDLDWFRRNDKTRYIKCFDQVREIVKDPRTGTGKPERLRYFEKRSLFEKNKPQGPLDLHDL